MSSQKSPESRRTRERRGSPGEVRRLLRPQAGRERGGLRGERGRHRPRQRREGPARLGLGAVQSFRGVVRLVEENLGSLQLST